MYFSPTPAEGARGSDPDVPTAVGCNNSSYLTQQQPSGSPSPAVCLHLGSPVHFCTQDFTKHGLQEVPQSCPFSSGSPAGCTTSLHLSTLYKMRLHSATSPPDTFSPSSKGSEEHRISSGLHRAAV